MLVSFSKFGDRKANSLHVERLEILRSKYVKSTKINEEIFKKDEHLQFIFDGTFSRIEVLVFFIVALLLITISISINSKFVLIVFVPYLVSINCLRNFRLRSREGVFMQEYPTVLLATASNLRAGLSIYSALERAIQLLDEDSVTKAEIKHLLEQIARGVPKEEAVGDFAKDIRLPEIRLFKRAFLLVLVHGGKFSRTLERLSEVSRDRDALIKSAKVSTASMRMTANVLLGMAPLLMLLLSLRTKNYWVTLLENPIAYNLASFGVMIVFLSYYLLRKLSDFKP